MIGLASFLVQSTCTNVAMSTIPNEGRSDPPVKPTSEVAHQPGQQPAASPEALADAANRAAPAGTSMMWPGSAVECSAERSRAPRDNGGARGGTRLGNPCDEDGLTR